MNIEHTLLTLILGRVLGKGVDFALSQLWKLVNKGCEFLMGMLFAIVFASLLKELERMQRGLAGVFLLIVVASVVGVSLIPVTKQQCIAA